MTDPFSSSFVPAGFIGYFVKLIHIPINNIIVYVLPLF